MYWFLMLVSFGLISVATLNPIPFLLVLAAYVLTRPVENSLRATVEAAGRNPELPLVPTDGTTCATCLLWFVVMGAVVLLFVGVVGAIATGELHQ